MPVRRSLLGATALLLMLQVLTTPGAASAGPRGHMLYNQGDAGDNAFWTSTHYLNTPQDDIEGADDFVVPAGHTWIVSAVGVRGEFESGESHNVSERVAFYDDAGGVPGEQIARYLNIHCCSMWGLGEFRIPISRAGLVLAPGTYWVSVQVNRIDSEIDQWYWQGRTVLTGNPAVIQGPGSPCRTWTPRNECWGTQGQGPDFVFAILGAEQS